jgi:hypothetical protein
MNLDSSSYTFCIAGMKRAKNHAKFCLLFIYLFLMGMKFCELFAQGGLNPRSS